jgi:hypothetical protein
MICSKLIATARYTSRCTIALPMMKYQRFGVPSALFYTIESTCYRLTLTAEAAGSSPVVPAIFSFIHSFLCPTNRVEFSFLRNNNYPYCLNGNPCEGRFP